MAFRDPSNARAPRGTPPLGDPLRVCWLHYGVEDAVWDRGILSALRSLDDVRVEPLDARVVDLLSFFDGASASPPDAVVNRVSDAQDPSLVKIVGAFLRLCEECFGDRVRVINGARAYGIGVSKTVQSAMLHRLELGQPTTRMVRRVGSCSRCLDDVRRAASDVGYPLLIKPNAGGFGAGIQRVDSAEQLEHVLGHGGQNSLFDASNDDVILLQKFHAVGDFYRVWHLGGKITCVARVTDTDPIANESVFEGVGDGSLERIDFNSCACSQSRKFTIIDPARVPGLREDIERITNSCWADMGSVEFLINTNLHENGEGEEKRLFFDINMLSTLPSLDRLGFEDEETRAQYQEKVNNLCEQTAAYIRERALDSGSKNGTARSSSPAAGARSDVHNAALE